MLNEWQEYLHELLEERIPGRLWWRERDVKRFYCEWDMKIWVSLW